MATTQLMLPGQLVKKHNELVRSKIDITSVQGAKILASLIACIHHDDTEFKNVYSIAVKDLLPDIGGGNYRQIKNICTELRRSGVEFEMCYPDGEKFFTTISFFSQIKYSKGIIEASFNSSNYEIANCLLNLKKQFTQYNLLEYLRLPSIYSQRLFEILKSWSDKPEIIIPVHRLHHILNVPQSLKNDFAQFRRRILEKAHSDITENTSFTYEWEPIKVGRSVERIRFLFAGNRRAIAEKVKEDARKEKQSRLNNSRFLRAVQCAQAKHGDCQAQDNRPIICKLCQRFDMCASVLSGLKQIERTKKVG